MTVHVVLCWAYLSPPNLVICTYDFCNACTVDWPIDNWFSQFIGWYHHDFAVFNPSQQTFKPMQLTIGEIGFLNFTILITIVCYPRLNSLLKARFYTQYHGLLMPWQWPWKCKARVIFDVRNVFLSDIIKQSIFCFVSFSKLQCILYIIFLYFLTLQTFGSKIILFKIK